MKFDVQYHERKPPKKSKQFLSKKDEKVYGILLDKYNIKWQINCDEQQNNICEVVSIELSNG